MYDLQLTIFGVIIAVLVLAWGLLMALNPTRFWDLARVDWNADVVDTRDRRKRHLVRVAGWTVTVLAFVLLVELLVAMFSPM